MEDQLTSEEKEILLKLARQALEEVVCSGQLAPLTLKELPRRLQEPGASFVTLTRRGELRGCIGALEPHQPLAEDVREHAVAAALQDYRFEPVQKAELREIQIEISRLTLPTHLPYECPEELVARLRPGIDGVIVRDGFYRATFLPQVWEKLADPCQFLDHLCLKMGAPAQYWRVKKLQVEVYQVEEFREK